MADDPSLQLAKLRAQLAGLDDAMASGVLTVEDADSGRITYRTYAEMRQARGDLAIRLRDLEGTLGPLLRPRTRQIVMTGRNGW